jgi:GMP synthase-like glutamine amidotransferase
MQLLAYALVGKVAPYIYREFGVATIHFSQPDGIFTDLPDEPRPLCRSSGLATTVRSANDLLRTGMHGAAG